MLIWKELNKARVTNLEHNVCNNNNFKVCLICKIPALDCCTCCNNVKLLVSNRYTKTKMLESLNTCSTQDKTAVCAFARCMMLCVPVCACCVCLCVPSHGQGEGLMGVCWWKGSPGEVHAELSDTGEAEDPGQPGDHHQKQCPGAKPLLVMHAIYYHTEWWYAIDGGHTRECEWILLLLLLRPPLLLLQFSSSDWTETDDGAGCEVHRRHAGWIWLALQNSTISG